MFRNEENDMVNEPKKKDINEIEPKKMRTIRKISEK